LWRSKKFIISAILAALVLAGSIGGIVYAQEDVEAEDTSPRLELLDKVAGKLGIDRQQLEDAFAEAIAEMRDEAQDEAQQYSEWWQARPDVQFNFGDGFFGGPGGPGGFRIQGRCGPGIWRIPEAE